MNLFEPYLLSHRSFATGKLLLPKKIYLQKSSIKFYVNHFKTASNTVCIKIHTSSILPDVTDTLALNDSATYIFFA